MSAGEFSLNVGEFSFNTHEPSAPAYELSFTTANLRPLKARFGPNLHKICPKVITLRKSAEKLSNLATVEKLMTLTQF